MSALPLAGSHSSLSYFTVMSRPHTPPARFTFWRTASIPNWASARKSLAMPVCTTVAANLISCELTPTSVAPEFWFWAQLAFEPADPPEVREPVLVPPDALPVATPVPPLRLPLVPLPPAVLPPPSLPELVPPLELPDEVLPEPLLEPRLVVWLPRRPFEPTTTPPSETVAPSLPPPSVESPSAVSSPPPAERSVPSPDLAELDDEPGRDRVNVDNRQMAITMMAAVHAPPEVCQLDLVGCIALVLPGAAGSVMS